MQITADVKIGPGGQISFKEEDSYSLNLAPITVQVIRIACLQILMRVSAVTLCEEHICIHPRASTCANRLSSHEALVDLNTLNH